MFESAVHDNDTLECHERLGLRIVIHNKIFISIVILRSVGGFHVEIITHLHTELLIFHYHSIDYITKLAVIKSSNQVKYVFSPYQGVTNHVVIYAAQNSS